ncbi:MAG TPA: DMT family transporter [Paracoccaceae bacterium]
MRLFLLAMLTMTAFAANSVLNRMAVGAGFIDPLGFAVLRLLAGALMLALLLGLRRVLRGGAVWPGAEGRLAGVFGLLLYLLGFSFAYLGLDAGTGALILFGMVQITMFGGALVSGELVPGRRWLGAGLAFAGLVTLLAPGGAVGGAGGGVVPAGAMALAGFGWGIYSLAGRGARDPLAATAANFVLALPVGLSLLLVPVGAAAVPLTAAGVWLAVVSGAVTSGLGYALWYALVPQLGAARAAVAQLTVPVIAAAAGLLLLGEGLGPRFVLAAGLVLGGVALASLNGQSRRSIR